MRKFFYNPPELLKMLYSNTEWETKNGKILLTFDDGPTEIATEKILYKLSEHKIKALFFCVGENIAKQKDLTKKILSAGHEIGSHTWSHKNIIFSSRAIFETEVEKVNELMKEKYNRKVKYFRPPYGRIRPSQTISVSNFQLKNIMWSLMTFDYQSNLENLRYAVDKYLCGDSIVVMHDSVKSVDIIEDAIDYLVETAENKKFKFGSPAECLK